ncbi:hypothetical protein [Arcticibacter sp. MXS-1]|uniref:hypothetical protein n=1 Tax=Arcticibacter sp. MXS-1 TaxID=3341726 RepID=UPI0035A93CD4
MLATELRIGNLIGREDGTAVEVTSEIITALQFKDEESRAYCSIALSAEWLDKFGFVRSSEDTYFFSSYPSLELRGQPAHMEVILDGAILLSREFFCTGFRTSFLNLPASRS